MVVDPFNNLLLQISLLNKLIAITSEIPHDGQLCGHCTLVAFDGYQLHYCMSLFGEPLTLQLYGEGRYMAGVLANKLYCSLCHFDDAQKR